jgi:hypothetical protein
MGLDWQKDAFGQSMGWDQHRFGEEMGFNYYNLDTQTQNALEIARLQADAQRSASKWGTAGQGLGAIGSIIGGYLGLSDIRVKENIEETESGALTALVNLPTYNYNFKEEVADDPRAGRGKKRGVMAQDLEKIAPELVKETTDGIKMVDPYGLLTLTIEGMKELDEKVSATVARLKSKKRGKK